MPKKWSPKSTLEYTYHFIDGTQCTIQVGHEGITEQDILVLRELDHRQYLLDRYSRENTNNNWVSNNSKPILAARQIDNIPDSNCDIFELLFGDHDPENELLVYLKDAMYCLSPEQLQLFNDLYGQCKPIVTVAHEYGIHENSIKGRRTRMLKKLQKLITENQQK